MSLTYHLDAFDGPLDLLLQLITRAKLDIRDVFVSSITEQFLAAVSVMEDWPVDLASDFLVMAALLLEIKSRAMLPKPPSEQDEDDESPEEALIRRLTEYKRFKEASEELRLYEQAASGALAKLPEEWIDDRAQEWSLSTLSLSALAEAFRLAMQRVATDEPEEEQRILAREIFTVTDAMKRIKDTLAHGKAAFTALLSARPNRDEVVTLFLALLELMRLGSIAVLQEETYGDISIRLA